MSYIHFSSGSLKELERLVRLFVITEYVPAGPLAGWIRIHPATSDSEPCLSEVGYTSRRMYRLTQLALKQHRPYRRDWTSKGLPFNARFYSVNLLEFRIEPMLTDVPREKMNAEVELRAWLESIGVAWEEFLPPAAEKLI